MGKIKFNSRIEQVKIIVIEELSSWESIPIFFVGEGSILSENSILTGCPMIFT